MVHFAQIYVCLYINREQTFKNVLSKGIMDPSLIFLLLRIVSPFRLDWNNPLVH